MSQSGELDKVLIDLREIFAQASIGNFDIPIKIPKEDGISAELYVGVKLMLESITEALKELKVVNLKLRRSEAYNKAILRGISEGVIATDLDGKIIFVNKAARKLLRISDDQAKSLESLYEVFQVLYLDGTPVPFSERASFKAMKSGKTISADYLYVKPDGKTVPISATASPIRINGYIRGAVCIFRIAAYRG